MNSSEASTSTSQPYDVFLNFHGGDTRDSFTDYLYHSLKSEYQVFRDEEGIRFGQQIPTTLLKAIQECKMSIVVLSENYGSSTWCLKELQMIMNRQEKGECHVLPIFLHIDPFEVRNQQGSFEGSFVEHQTTYSNRMQIVEGWRTALQTVGYLKGIHVKKGSSQVEVIQKVIREVESHIGKKGITVLEPRKDAFPVPELVGESFKNDRDNIWSLLMKDEVTRIGVYGGNGAGKTTMLKHVYNKLLEKPRRFPHVYWIATTQNCNAEKLRDLIRLELSNREDAKERKELVRRDVFVLIIDDIWKSFDLLEVGFPPNKGYKLIFATTSLEVCRKMDCENNIIKLEPLSGDDAWELFRREVGAYDIEMEVTARDIASECAGLPFAIKTIGRWLKGKEDRSVWTNTLDEIRDPFRVRGSPMDQVLEKLMVSYDFLNDASTKQCLLYCALFPESFWISKEELTEYLIVEGITGRKNCKREEIDKGRTMLYTLVDRCLLEHDEVKQLVKMPDLVRGMALRILSQESSVMVEAGMELTECPDVDEWNENLVRVSLMRNNIRAIGSNPLPVCPDLSTLLLCHNHELGSISDPFFVGFNGHKIPESISNLVTHATLLLGDCFHWIFHLFFERLGGLKVLDLSSTGIGRLPTSISNLVNLSALLLGDCSELTYIPSLAKLVALEKLDLRGCRTIQEVPHGLASLYKLRFLDLTDCHNLKNFPVGILPNLSRLQVLRIEKKLTLKGEEVGCLNKLEDLVCGFPNLYEMNNYVQSKTDARLPHAFEIYVNNETVAARAKSRLTKYVNLSHCDLSSGADVQALPQGTEAIEFSYCELEASNFSVLDNASEMKSIRIFNCGGVECLASLPGSSSASAFSRLEFLQLFFTNSLHTLVRNENENGDPLPFPSTGTFACLKSIEIKSCGNLKNLFPLGLLQNLQNLEKLVVEDCAGLKEIVATEQDSTSYSSGSVTLRKLKELRLIHLPSLKSISHVELRCGSLRDFKREDCPELPKSIPISFC